MKQPSLDLGSGARLSAPGDAVPGGLRLPKPNEKFLY